MFVVALMFGLIGYIVGLITSYNMSDWPMNVGGFGEKTELSSAMLQVKNWDNFIIAGMIHNFSYLGAGVGLVIALFKQFRILKNMP